MTLAPSTAVRRSLTRIGLEIVIGFVGVYAAFALSAYKDRRDLVDRRHQIKRALIAEIRPIADLARSNGPGYKQFLHAFDSSVAAKRPMPRAFLDAVDEHDHVWEATKQGGGLMLIDVPTFVELAGYYNMNSRMFAQYAQLRDFSIAEILPHVAAGPKGFLVPGTDSIRPAFVIYRRALSRLTNMNEALARGGDSLIARLAKDTI